MNFPTVFEFQNNLVSTTGLPSSTSSKPKSTYHADTTFSDFVVPADSKAIVDAWGAVSLTSCPLKKLEAHIAGSAIFFAEQFGSFTLQKMTPCENCVGHTFMRTSQAAVYSDGSKGVCTHACCPGSFA